MLDAVDYEVMDLVNSFAHQTVYRGPPTCTLEAELGSFGFAGHFHTRGPSLLT